MKISEGTKSVLIGSHSIVHSILIVIAWKKLYGKFPNWKMVICILLHDIGYCGMNHITNKSNVGHSDLGANIAEKLFGKHYGDIVRYHTYGAAKRDGRELSVLEKPDEYSFIIAPRWWMKLNAVIEGFEIDPDIWVAALKKNFDAKERRSGTEMFNELRTK